VRLQEKAEQLRSTIYHLGGSVHVFERVGRLQLILCLKEGLYPDSKVLDIGCGCLRGGYWLIHFLDPGCYFGIEPNRDVLDAGVKHFLEPGLVETKCPRFDYNSSFDASLFGEVFDFYVARSIWTHASKLQIQTMLDSFVRHSSSDAVFLTSYRRAGFRRGRDYGGTGWRGVSHASRTRGMVCHSFRWITQACRQRGLLVEEITDKAYNFGTQTWLKITK
jgi:hypothetical protein